MAPKKSKTKDKTPLQQRLLDAVERCFSRDGIQKTTLADVAEEAGVSRMTVYRQFEDRQALFSSAALRNMRRQWDTISARVQGVKQLEEWLLQALMEFHRRFSNDPTVHLYIRIGGIGPGLDVALSEAGLKAVSVHFQSLFDQAEGEGRLAPGLTVEHIAEWIHRTNHSLIDHPSEGLGSEDDLERWLGAQIAGGLVRV